MRKTIYNILYILILTAIILLGLIFLNNQFLCIYSLCVGYFIGSGKYKNFIFYIIDPYKSDWK